MADVEPPMNPRTLVVLCVIALGCSVAGCVSRKLNYPNKVPIAIKADGRPDANSVIYPAESRNQSRGVPLKVPLAIIEFGDQGDARDKSQIEAAKLMIRNVRKPLLVVYVHGWHNNATTYPARFPLLLNMLAESPHIRRDGYQVVGVYIGWHGKVYSDLLLEYGATFWSRYEAGARLGAGVDCLAAISDVVAEAREHNDARTFLIGHSFGALVLQQAIAQSVSAAKRDGSSFAPADLTLFLNSASDSEITRQMIERLRTTVKVEGGAESAPIFASITSATDSATKNFFKIGRTLGSGGKAFDEYEVDREDGTSRSVSGSYFYKHTPGHNLYLRSHVTSDLGPVAKPAGYLNAFEANLETNINPKHAVFRTSDSTTGQWRSWSLEPVVDPVTPYWVILADQEIMDGHNDVFNERSIAMMAALYRMNNQLKARVKDIKLARTGRAEQKVALPAAQKVEEYIREIKNAPPSGKPSTPVPMTMPPGAASPGPTEARTPPGRPSRRASGN